MEDITIKPLNAEYDAFMWELLYKNIFIARENEFADREITDLPELKNYIIDWGLNSSDLGYIALDKDNQPVGAVWTRIFKHDDQMWAYIDDETPELNIAVVKSARGNGLGNLLLNTIVETLADDYDQVSLSVHPNNRAVNLYKKHGFTIYEQKANALVMLKKL